MIVSVEDIIICVVPSYHTVPVPLPQVNRSLYRPDSFLHCNGLNKCVEEPILMDCQFLMEPEIVIYQELPSVCLSMHKHIIPSMRNQCQFPRVCHRFFRECCPQGVILVFCHCTENQMQTEDTLKAIIEVAEHHPIGIRCVKSCVPCFRHSTFGNAHLTDTERIPVKALLREFVLLPVIDEDDTHIAEVHHFLHGKHIELLFAYIPRFLVVGDN